MTELLDIEDIASQVPLVAQADECHQIALEIQTGMLGLTHLSGLRGEELNVEVGAAVMFLRRVLNDYTRFRFGVRSTEVADVLYNPAEVYRYFAQDVMRGSNWPFEETVAADTMFFNALSLYPPLVRVVLGKETVNDLKQIEDQTMDFVGLTMPYNKMAYRITDDFARDNIAKGKPASFMG